jgi:magnesium transporter
VIQETSGVTVPAGLRPPPVKTRVFGMLSAQCHTSTNGWVEVRNLADISDFRTESGNVVWGEADVADLTGEQISLIAEEFGLDPLAVEDAQESNHRLKLETYGSHLLVVIQQLDEVKGQLEAKALFLYVGDNYVLALHHGADRLLDKAKVRWAGAEPQEFERGPAYLLYVLLDTLVDDYQVIAERLEEEVEELEDSALSRSTDTGDLDRRLYKLKQQLSRLRRYAVPGSRVLDLYVQDHTRDPAAAEEIKRFREVHDNLMRVTEQIHNVDDLANAILELRRADQTAGQNEITKRLTGWAAIIAVPTLVSGIYGMNFELVPSSGNLFGFFFALTVMLGASMSLYLLFKTKGWI